MTPSSFQAVNKQAANHNSDVASAAAHSTAQRGSSASAGATPPPKGAVVAQKAAQTTQPSSDGLNLQQPSSQMDGLDGTMTETASYGTRSRNRNARPNYAEDQEMDFDFASAATTTKKAQPNSASSAGPNAAEAKRAKDFADLVGMNGNNTGPSTPQNGARDSPAAPAAATNPKKRKAASALTNSVPTPPQTSAPAPVAARKTGAYAPPAMARETNVMSFNKHRSCLNKKGELIADDGTKLCVNGKHPPTTSPFSRLQPTPPQTNA